MAGSKAPERPLSPYLIYRWPLPMMMSILHRITGGALYFGTALLVWWLLAAASGANAYAKVQWVMGSIIGQIILFGYTWALVHHMLGGLRHFVGDFGYGLTAPARNRLALANIVLSIAIAILLWIIGLGLRG